ncbi:TonB-dependent receptor [Sphingomonas sp. BGYR3]|uniref:TonB-dependent receptor n=1 Tax=Sphingomonas sp. BGYR3 TaxID=2975483 RepID=UPI0021A4847E|nr:TonB-dependent receptor [Sphingomonas sp. BGYR3]MDG5487909.1 TonB-dependent receptor [Sphingomonas sp. BGYR3]
MNRTSCKRGRHFRAGTALQALALLGVGVAGSVAFAAPAAAQDFTFVTATGRVTNETGAPIEGATVKITSDDQGFERTVTTDGSGSYRIPQLPAGKYTFEVNADGFGTYRESGIALSQSAAGNTFQLSEGTASTGDDIVVTGTRIKVADFDRTTVGAVISIGELATRVPVARDLTSVVLLAPGTSAGDSAFGNLAAVSGSSVSENSFFLNGLNITDFRQGLGSVEVPFEFYDTVEIKNGGIPAEFGRFTGGFINAITKSGSNEFHGKVLSTYIPDEATSDRPNTLIEQNDQDTRETFETLVSLSGPIIKDRLFFYAFYQHNNVSSGDTLLTVAPSTVLRPAATGGAPVINPVTGQVVTAPIAFAPYSTGLRREEVNFDSPFYGGKLDFIPFDGHRLEFTYFNSERITKIRSLAVTDANGGAYDSRIDGPTPTIGAFQGLGLQEAGGENYVGRYTGQLADFITVSGAYGKNKRRVNVTSSRPDYPSIGDTTGNGYAGNADTTLQTAEDEREFYRGDIDLYFSLLGDHHIKFGYDREKLSTNQTVSYTGGVAWTYYRGAAGDPYVQNPNAIYVAGRTFINGGLFTSDNEAFYIQDSWQLFDNRLTLNLGVRSDQFTNDNVIGDTYYDSGRNIAPRLSFAFDPAGNGRTKLYGSYGRYFLPVPSNTNVRLAGAELDYTRYFLVNGVNSDNTPILGAPVTGFPDATACPDNPSVRNCDIISDGQPTPTIATVAQGLKPQSVDEFILGAEQRVGDRVRLGVFGVYRKLNESLEDIAIDAAVNAYCEQNNIAGCGDIWTGFHQYVLANPGADATITLSDPLPGETSLRTIDFTGAELGYPQAKRTYKAVTVTFDREFDGVWSLSANYTWSKTEGNIEGGIRSDNGQTDSGLTTAFDQPGLTNGAYGPLPGDRTHIFKLFGSYKLFDSITIGGQFQALSPRKFGCLGRVPVSVDAFAGAYGAAGFYCNLNANGEVITDPLFPFTNSATATTLQLTPRGSVLKSDWQTFTNVSVTFEVPTDAFDAFFRVDVFNLFNEKAVNDIREVGTLNNGTPRGDYGSPLTFQQPRFFRFQLGVGF